MFLLGCLAGFWPCFGQHENNPPETGKIVYAPERNELDEFRNPFHYVSRSFDDPSWAIYDRLPFMLSQLELKGIYLDLRKGYVAIFRVGDRWEWWREGTKFLDADLVNISDADVTFKHYSSGYDLYVRMVVKKLDPNEK